MDFFPDDVEKPEENVDSVEADILLDAPIEDVWALVSEPGWWINDGPLGDHEVEQDDTGVYHINDPEAGTWLVEKADEDPMDIVTYRWYPLASDELPEDYVTRVEVSLSDEAGKIALHVEEQGLSTVSDDEEEARQAWEDAAATWEEALQSVKRHFEKA
ncbi:MAG: toxin [Actinobacteria bacterium]|nr:MAG: toxin [Actinomycetota bacterium]